MKTRLLSLLLVLLLLPGVSAGSVLFDLTKNEDAGNADWRIDGAYSSWADDLRSLGYTVDQLSPGEMITYGDPSNPKDLSKYDVFILPEPQNPFTSEEIEAIKDFVYNGGVLIYIADHKSSDRDNDGWDSWKIWNENLNFDSLLGITLENTQIPSDTVITDIVQDPLTENVGKIGIWLGTSISVSGDAKALAWYEDNLAAWAYAKYGKGTVIVFGDSSTFSDGSCKTSCSHNNDNYHEYDDRQVAINMVLLSGNGTGETGNRAYAIDDAYAYYRDGAFHWEDNYYDSTYGDYILFVGNGSTYRMERAYFKFNVSEDGKANLCLYVVYSSREVEISLYNTTNDWNSGEHLPLGNLLGTLRVNESERYYCFENVSVRKGFESFVVKLKDESQSGYVKVSSTDASRNRPYVEMVKSEGENNHTTPEGLVVINEIMYNPEGSDEGREWVELYNPNDFTVDVSGWSLKDNNGGVTFSQGTEIPPHGYLVVSSDPDKLREDYSSDENFDPLNVYSERATFLLSNSGDKVTLTDKYGNVVDEVFYDDGWGADGNGKSLERKDLFKDSNDPNNWAESSKDGGTPTYRNTVQVPFFGTGVVGLAVLFLVLLLGRR